jgi:plastocyanin
MHTVHIVLGKFDPAELEITSGDTVEFINDTRGVHTVTADPTLAKDPANVVLPAGAKVFHSGSIPPGEVFTHVFDVEGDYQYVCLPHERMGMIAKIHVLP